MKFIVKGVNISIKNIDDEDYLCLTDMLKAKDGDFFISDWLRNRNTVEFLGIWEKIHNPNFNYGEYATIRNQSGLNNYKISVKEFVSKTNAISLKSKTGRYGGTYAHKDIAFEFGMWISAEFKIYLIKEFQRLKNAENKNKTWDIKRTLSKINYKIQTNAIKEKLIPKKLNSNSVFVYANEADILNLALFNITAKEWKNKNKTKSGNIRDYANITQLIVLSNLENINAFLIKENIDEKTRILKLNELAISQMNLLSIQNSKLEKDLNKNIGRLNIK